MIGHGERLFRSQVQVPLILLLSFCCMISVTFAWIQQLQCRPSHLRQVSQPRKQLFHDAATSATTTTTCCFLFTRPIINSKNAPSSFNRNDVQYDNFIGTNLPWNIELKRSNVSGASSGDELQQLSSSLILPTTTKLSIRLMQYKDIESIVTMNVQEYGMGPAYFPWSNLALMESWIDRQYLTWLVDISCRIKVFNYFMDDSSSFTTPTTPAVNDHAILVGVLHDDAECDDERIVVGMIEVSLQPLNPQVTPSPIPIPIDMKCALATITTRNSQLVGWITNLLIVPQYRGCGYSKIFIAACEQMAKSNWNCTSIHLHCDADPISGMVPQKLYTQLGYRSPTPIQGQYNVPTTSMMTTTTTRLLQQSSVVVDPSPYIVEIEGVPLMYLRKDI